MYITNSIIEGLKIIGFDSQTIKKLAREKSLEEIFLSNLFLNYLIVMIIYLLGLVQGTFTIEGREINMPVLFAFLMVYPFLFNLAVYVVYGLFGFIAEMLDNQKRIKPLLSVGFHSSIVYAIIIYIIALISSFNIAFGFFLLSAFIILFFVVMFRVLSVVYSFSLHQILIIIFLPIILIVGIYIIANLFFPEFFSNIIRLIIQ